MALLREALKQGIFYRIPGAPGEAGAFGAPGALGALGAPGAPGADGALGDSGRVAPHLLHIVLVALFSLPHSGHFFAMFASGGLKHISFSLSVVENIFVNISAALLFCRCRAPSIT